MADDEFEKFRKWGCQVFPTASTLEWKVKLGKKINFGNDFEVSQSPSVYNIFYLKFNLHTWITDWN